MHDDHVDSQSGGAVFAGPVDGLGCAVSVLGVGGGVADMAESPGAAVGPAVRSPECGATGRCTVGHGLARAEFVRLYRQAVREIFFGVYPVPSVDWVAHMIGVAGTFGVEWRERVRQGLLFAIRCRREKGGA